MVILRLLYYPIHFKNNGYQKWGFHSQYFECSFLFLNFILGTTRLTLRTHPEDKDAQNQASYSNTQVYQNAL